MILIVSYIGIDWYVFVVCDIFMEGGLIEDYFVCLLLWLGDMFICDEFVCEYG